MIDREVWTSGRSLYDSEEGNVLVLRISFPGGELRQQESAPGGSFTFDFRGSRMAVEWGRAPSVQLESSGGRRARLDGCYIVYVGRRPSIEMNGGGAGVEWGSVAVRT